MEPATPQPPILNALPQVPLYKEIMTYVRKLAAYQQATIKLHQKDLVVVVGLTGSGKSTLCHATAKPGSVEFDEDEGVYVVSPG